jgi:hypothetical protein
MSMQRTEKVQGVGIIQESGKSTTLLFETKPTLLADEATLCKL